MGKMIKEYTVGIVEPGCSPGSGRYGVQINLGNDISQVFPYLNAVIEDGYYDHANQILVWRESDQAYSFQPKEIRIGRIDDSARAIQIADELIARINRIWETRNGISPCYDERKRPTVIDLFKLLPKTNCKQCGLPTCLAYADALRSGTAALANCPIISAPRFTENKAKLESILFRL